MDGIGPSCISLGFPHARVGSVLAWDSASRHLAVELEPPERPGQAAREPHAASICVVDHDSPRSSRVLRLPLASSQDALLSLSWAPPPSQRTLLAITSRGRAQAWSPLGPAATSTQVVTDSCWHGREAWSLNLASPRERLVLARRLRPPRPWNVGAAPPNNRTALRVAGAADLFQFWRAHGVERAFAAGWEGLGGEDAAGGAGSQKPGDDSGSGATPTFPLPSSASPGRPPRALSWLREGQQLWAGVSDGGRLYLSWRVLGDWTSSRGLLLHTRGSIQSLTCTPREGGAPRGEGGADADLPRVVGADVAVAEGEVLLVALVFRKGRSQELGLVRVDGVPHLLAARDGRSRGASDKARGPAERAAASQARTTQPEDGVDPSSLAEQAASRSDSRDALLSALQGLEAPREWGGSLCSTGTRIVSELPSSPLTPAALPRAKSPGAKGGVPWPSACQARREALPACPCVLGAAFVPEQQGRHLAVVLGEPAGESGHLSVVLLERRRGKEGEGAGEGVEDGAAFASNPNAASRIGEVPGAELDSPVGSGAHAALATLHSTTLAPRAGSFSPLPPAACAGIPAGARPAKWALLTERLLVREWSWDERAGAPEVRVEPSPDGTLLLVLVGRTAFVLHAATLADARGLTGTDVDAVGLPALAWGKRAERGERRGEADERRGEADEKRGGADERRGEMPREIPDAASRAKDADLACSPAPPLVASRPTRGVAFSPNAMYLAAITRGSRAVRLIPLWEAVLLNTSRQIAVELAKRQAFALLCGLASWDLTRAAVCLGARWGPTVMSFYLDLVDSAVHASRAALRPQLADAWALAKCRQLAAAPDDLGRCVATDLATVALVQHVACVLELQHGGGDEQGPGRDAGGNEKERERAAKEVKLRRARRHAEFRHWAAHVAELGAYLVRCLALWVRRRRSQPGAPSSGGTAALGWALGSGSAGGAAASGANGSSGAAATLKPSSSSHWPSEWVARVNAHPDCVPGARCLASARFLRAMISCLHAAAMYSAISDRMLQGDRARAGAEGGAPPSQSSAELKTIVAINKLLSAVFKAASQSKDPREPAGSHATGGGLPASDAALAKWGGPWRLHVARASPALSWQEVEVALQAGRAAAGEHGARLLDAHEDDTCASLLDLADSLGLSPGWRPRRDSPLSVEAATAAVAWGESQLALAAQSAALDEELPVEGWDAGWTGVRGATPPPEARKTKPAAAAHAPPPPRLRPTREGPFSAAQSAAPLKRAAPDEPRVSDERLAKRVGPGADLFADVALSPFDPEPALGEGGGIDCLTGAKLSWSNVPAYATADGRMLTAELQPHALTPGSTTSWQAAWATAAPFVGGPWRFLGDE